MKNLGSKLLIAGLYTLAVLGSFVFAIICYGLLGGLGLNEDLALGLSMLGWIIVLAIGVFGIVFFHNSTKSQVEHITIVHEVTPQVIPQLPTVEAEHQLFLDEPTPPAAPHTYRSMLQEGDKKDEELS